MASWAVFEISYKDIQSLYRAKPQRKGGICFVSFIKEKDEQKECSKNDRELI
jgi:hypothetical protein